MKDRTQYIKAVVSYSVSRVQYLRLILAQGNLLAVEMMYILSIVELFLQDGIPLIMQFYSTRNWTAVLNRRAPFDIDCRRKTLSHYLYSFGKRKLRLPLHCIRSIGLKNSNAVNVISGWLCKTRMSGSSEWLGASTRKCSDLQQWECKSLLQLECSIFKARD